MATFMGTCSSVGLSCIRHRTTTLAPKDGSDAVACVPISRLPARRSNLFNIHLGTSFLERRQQARKLVSAEILHDRNLCGPRLVFGDFNEWTRGLTTRLLCRQF